MIFIRRATAFVWIAGPFVSDTDGRTPVTDLEIVWGAGRLFRTGESDHSAIHGLLNNPATHVYAGLYPIPLDATDTVGTENLQVFIKMAGALIVRENFALLAPDVYDRMFSFAIPEGAVATDAGNSVSQVKTTMPETQTDFWRNAFLTFTSGSLKGQTRQIVSYNGSTKIMAPGAPFSLTPDDGDAFILVNR